ncbi:hypothetical protein PCASD_05242 [Puccinia coronata f. sp. avenae]|uniref:GYF domain-containing protein n=2 Tax=Puccinia coronata f. sp. avenae TaxID=200324 RepID=A0A2N5TGX3_9BASI|nr:hypothetical protein PCASD_05242 [Puccinia coronata f. sp. avenae]
MSNKRSLDQPLEQSPTSLNNQAKKVKFGALPSSSKSNSNVASSTFEPTDNSTDLQFDELNQVGKIKRGRVKVDGYDSDSSTENTEVRSSKKDKSKNQADEDDIFADEKDQDEKKIHNKNHPKFEKIDVGLKVRKGAEEKEYLELGDIEGQEFGKEEDEDDDDENEGKSGEKNGAGHKKQQDDESANDYSDEEEDFVPGDEFANDDDAPRARRKSKKGMGFLLSKFNMAEELQEGRMAADGSYVASARDPEAVHDNWLEGMNKKTIKQAREAKRMREEQLRTQAEKEESMASLRTRKECYIALLGLLPAGDGRSVSQILCQLGNEKRALQQTENKPKKKVVKKSAIDSIVPDSMVIENGNAQDHPTFNPETVPTGKSTTQPKSEEQIKLDRRIGEITDLASMLMGTHGELDIYDMSHGSITGILKSEGLVSRDWIPPSVQEELKSRTDLQADGATDDPAPEPAQKSLISRPTTKISAATPSRCAQIYYKFLVNPSPLPPGSDPPVYGPFDQLTMDSWAQQGFFGTNFERILVKIDSSPLGNAPWGPWNQIINQQLS